MISKQVYRWTLASSSQRVRIILECWCLVFFLQKSCTKAVIWNKKWLIWTCWYVGNKWIGLLPAENEISKLCLLNYQSKGLMAWMTAWASVRNTTFPMINVREKHRRAFIHSFSAAYPIRGCRGAGAYLGIIRRRRGTPWTSHQFITGLTCREITEEQNGSNI